MRLYTKRTTILGYFSPIIKDSRVLSVIWGLSLEQWSKQEETTLRELVCNNPPNAAWASVASSAKPIIAARCHVLNVGVE